MVISHRYKFVFIRNPKCASTTLREILTPYADFRLKEGQPTDGKWSQHSSAWELRNRFLEEEWDWDQYFSFITIRNPWDRLVSIFTYARHDSAGRPFYREGYDPTTVGRYPFAEFIKEMCSEDPAINLRHRTWDPAGTRCLVDCVLRIEDLPAGLTPVFERLGIPLPENLPRHNATVHKSYQEYYTPELRQAVERCFAPDIEFGKYTF